MPISWAVLIAALVERGYGEEALHLYDRVRNEAIMSSAAMWVCSLKACSTTGVAGINKGREIHGEITKRGMPANDPFTQSALIAFYIEHGLLADAWKLLLDGVSTTRDRVSWTIVANGHLDNGCYDQALECFGHMKREGIPPDEVAFLAAFAACGRVGASVMGLELHSDAIKMGFDSELAVGNSLVDMYASCGFSTEARQAFDALAHRDSVSWNAVIDCCSQHGDSVGALGLFEAMRRGGGHPDSFTFFSILSACSHSGLAECGFVLFASMSCDYFLDPSFEHYTCIVDSLARIGLVKEAMWAIENVPLHPCLAMWHIVLGACDKSRDVDDDDHHRGLGIRAFKHALQLNEMDSAAYVALSNILAFG
jgi:pentatricopeptide repeat protein